MTATALQTFGVTSTILSAYLPQVGFEGADDLLTTARVTQLVEDAAAEVCGYLVAAGVDVTALAADTSSAAYKLVQRVTVRYTLPLIMRAVGMAAEAILASEEGAEKAMARLIANPALLGYDTATNGDTYAWSRAQDFSDLADTHPAVARQWAVGTDGTGYRW